MEDELERLPLHKVTCVSWQCESWSLRTSSACTILNDGNTGLLKNYSIEKPAQAETTQSGEEALDGSSLMA